MHNESRLNQRQWEGIPWQRSRERALSLRFAHERVLVIVTTIVAALVRLPTLGAKSLWYDELISISIAQHSISAILRARLRVNAGDALIDQLFTNNPPLHLVIIHWTRMISTSDAAMRLPFAVAGIMTVPVVYALLRRLLGPFPAAAGTICFALSPLHISYSQEARPTVLLVLFSLLGFLALIKATDEGRRRDWVMFVVFALLNAWSSYFALIAIFPTFAALWAIMLVAKHRRSDTSVIESIKPGVIAGITILVGCLPLTGDLRAIAQMNDASLTAAPSFSRSLLSAGWMVTQMANPLPGVSWSVLLTAVLVTSGIITLVKTRTSEIALAMTWLVLPCLILLSIQSSHVLNMRYVLAAVPIVMAMPIYGGLGLLPPPLRRAKPGIVKTLGVLLVVGIVLVNVQGIRAYEEIAIQTGPIKPDWRDAVMLYADSAGPESCLVIVDGLGNAFSGVVPYYLQRAGDTAQCSIDARDPRLLDVSTRHPDLWWAISTQWYYPKQTDALLEVLRAEGSVEIFDLVVVFHPRDQVTGSNPQAMDAFLRRAIVAAEPDDCRGSILAPALRESLANLAALQFDDPQEVAVLVAGFIPPMHDNDDLMWERAEQRLARGSLDDARQIGVRLVGLYPGDPRVYDLLSRIEHAAGNETWQSFERVSLALKAAAPNVDGQSAAECWVN